MWINRLNLRHLLLLALLGILAFVPGLAEAFPSSAISASNGGPVTPGRLMLAVQNTTGSTLTAGTLVNIALSNGWDAATNLPLVEKADAAATGHVAAYVVTADITTGSSGIVAKTYRLTGVNTIAASAVGIPVFLDTTPGGWTISAPFGSTYRVEVVGQVAVKSATVGEIQFDLASQGLVRIGANELQPGSAAPVSAWTAMRVTGGAIGEGANFNPPFRAVTAGKFRHVTCSWSTAGTGGATGVVAEILVDGGAALCSCTLGACTTTADAAVTCDCGGAGGTAFLSDVNYVVQLKSTTDCTINPAAIFCAITIGQ